MWLGSMVRSNNNFIFTDQSLILFTSLKEILFQLFFLHISANDMRKICESLTERSGRKPKMNKK